MKKKLLIGLTALALILSGCAAPTGSSGEGSSAFAVSGEDVRVRVVATTYPVYLLASAVTEGIQGVRVERLNTGETSCLHDYTLSVDDMKKIENADVIVLNGVGLEEFMEDALAASDAQVIDCSQNVPLLENLTHHHEEGEDHDHDHGHWDPHIWMDPSNAQIMVKNIEAGMKSADAASAQEYEFNCLDALALLDAWDSNVRDMLTGVQAAREGFSIPGLITFHDGFQYFCHAYDLPLLEAIEEEAGSEASAKEILEISQMVTDEAIPVIFTEVNGSDATANTIARETGCRVAQLTMMMDGPDAELSNYLDGLMENMMAVVNGFAGEEVVQ